MEAQRNHFVGKWRYTPNLDLPKVEAETHWLNFCQSYRKPTDELVLHWIEGRAIPAHDEKFGFLVAARFEAVRWFLSGFSWIRVGLSGPHFESHIPQPPEDRKEVLRAFLIDWWWGRGVFFQFASGWEAHTAIE